MRKLMKGFFALFVINLLLFVSVCIIQSCKKNDYSKSNSSVESQRFNALGKITKDELLKVSFKKSMSEPNSLARANYATSGTQKIYLDFPTEITQEIQSMYDNARTIQDITNLISVSNATINYEETAANKNYAFDIPVEPVITSLHPMITEAKKYLYSKGFTDQDINEMLQNEDVGEESLVPFVAVLTYLENKQSTTKINPATFFFNSAQAQTVGGCILEALGADALWAIGGSNLSSWTKAAIMKAFPAIAKRFLGPIGVAIAVITFSYCMWG